MHDEVDALYRVLHMPRLTLQTQAVLAVLLERATGTAVGLLCARPITRSVGWSVVAGGGALLITGAQPWLPPVGLALRELGGGLVPTVGLAVQAALGLALAGLAAGATVIAHNRR
jgi:hypothetical protein